MITIKIDTDNAAFEYERSEIARILREIADRIERGEEVNFAMDYNGNKVGRVEYEPRSEY